MFITDRQITALQKQIEKELINTLKLKEEEKQILNEYPFYIDLSYEDMENPTVTIFTKDGRLPYGVLIETAGLDEKELYKKLRCTMVVLILELLKTFVEEKQE